MTIAPPPPPQHSPDGQWWWTGTEWVPAGAVRTVMPAPAVEAPGKPWWATPIGDLRRQSVRAQVVFGLAVGVLILVALMIWSAVEEDQREQEFQQRACESGLVDC